MQRVGYLVWYHLRFSYGFLVYLNAKSVYICLLFFHIFNLFPFDPHRAVLLVISAVMLTYKLLLLQATIESSSTSPEFGSHLDSNSAHQSIYHLHNQYHTATIERFHQVLRANIQLLSQVSISCHFIIFMVILCMFYLCNPTILWACRGMLGVNH